MHDGHRRNEAHMGETPVPDLHPPTTASAPLFPEVTRELVEQRAQLAPSPSAAFRAFSKSVFAQGALTERTKQLIAVAVAHATQCPYCIRSHTAAALDRGATAEELMEAIWVSAEMRAGAVYAHSLLALDTVAAHTVRKEA
jgi:AhpD family alkylhydroperoxidase